MREQILADYVARGTRRFERGLWDCCAWAAGWAEELTGTLPGRNWMGRKLSDREALRIVRDAGGLPELVAKTLSEAGWRRVEEPEEGDICLIEAEEGLLPQSVGVFRRGKVLAVAESGAYRLLDPFVIQEVWRWE